MFVIDPLYIAGEIEKPAGKAPLFIPKVYEKEQPQAQPWEYHVLVIDPSEVQVPSAEQLNALGQQGWILVGLLDERATGRGSFIYYYFTRQVHNSTV
jgi:hypothetical protein